MDYLFKTSGLKVGYNNFFMSDIDICVENSSLNAILSPNTCGKTSLIKTFSGVILPLDGDIYLDGVKYSKRTFKKYKSKFGVVFEDFNIFLTDRVVDELYFPLVHLEYKKKNIKERVSLISSTLGIENILDKKISELSLYEKLLVSIATSIIHLPKILFIDDIFKFFNEEEKNGIMSCLKKIVSSLSISVLFTTSMVMDVIDVQNIYVITEKIKMHGNFKEIIKMDNELVKLGFDIPIMIDLSRKLQFYNLIDDIYFDPNEVVDKLWN